MRKNMTYNVKEASEKTQISVHNIRYYTNLGLVPCLQHDEHGNRVFDDEALNWLTCIRFLMDSGMSLADIKHYFELCLAGNKTLQERCKILEALLEQSEQELAMAQKRTKCIQSKVMQCRRTLSGEIPDDCNPLNWD